MSSLVEYLKIFSSKSETIYILCVCVCVCKLYKFEQKGFWDHQQENNAKRQIIEEKWLGVYIWPTLLH